MLDNIQVLVNISIRSTVVVGKGEPWWAELLELVFP